ALTGRLPFTATNAVALIHQHVNVPAPRVATRARSVPAKLAEAVDRCLEKNPVQRFATGEELANAVAAVETPPLAVPPEIRVLIRRIRTAGAFFVGVGLAYPVLFEVIRQMRPALTFRYQFLSRQLALTMALSTVLVVVARL